MTFFVVFAAGWLAGWLLLWRPPTLTPVPPGSALPVTVIVPARNEAANLPGLLDSLETQILSPSQVIVVDDDSSDDTAAVASAHPLGVTVIPGRPLPDGWAGKPWALAQGVAASGPAPTLIVLLDADVTLAPEALAALAGAHGRLGGLVSVAPRHLTRRPYESLSAVFNAVGVGASGIALPGRHGRTWAAFGPCVAVASDSLAAIGGVAVIASSVVDDLDLARAARRQGLAVHGFTGGSLVGYRMYADGLIQLVQGWTKNIAAGFIRTPPVYALLGFGWVTAMLMPVAGLSVGWGTALVAEILVAAQCFVTFRRVGRFAPWAPIAAPLLAMAFVAVFLRSAFLVAARRSVQWRGRSVAARR